MSSHWHLLAGLVFVFASTYAHAYESDVHYGLTRWLAREAGFDETQAEWIAVANQRIDGGMMETSELGLEYACAGRYVETAQQAQRQRFPAATRVPAPPSARAVVPGGDAARVLLLDALRQAQGKEGLMMVKLGAALHTLQDSWSHQGVPGTPDYLAAVCDSTLFSGHSPSRGGADAHDADLTSLYVDDGAAMARATYSALQSYPPIQGRVREAAIWERLSGPVHEFLRATTKTAKRQWFVAHGVANTGFLAGTTLPDGQDPGPLLGDGRRLPQLPAGGSTQHTVAPQLRDFFDRVLERWIGRESVEALVADLGPDATADGSRPKRLGTAARELAARLTLWKLRDHGSAAKLAHAKAPLGTAQLRTVAHLARDPAAFVQAASVAEAVWPLQESGPLATPLLPYIVRPLPGARERFVAIARLRHAPYDSVGWVAEQRGGKWTLVDIASVVDQ